MAEVAKLFNLLRVEWLKIRKRPRTWILAALVVIAVFVTGLVMNNMASSAGDENWKERLVQENQMYQSNFTNPETSDVLRKTAEANIKINQYHLDNNINPDQPDALSFVSMASELSVLVGIFAVIIAGDIVASEFTWGTVKMLLIRPVSRTKILLGKYITSVLFGLFLFVLLFASAFAIGGVWFGFGDMNIPHYYVDPTDSTVQSSTILEHVVTSFGLQFINVLMAITIAFMIGAIFRSSSMSISISILLLMIGPNVTKFLTEFSWSKYVLWANTDLTQHLEGPKLFADTTMTFSLTMLAVYFVAFHVISWYMFTKRDVGA